MATANTTKTAANNKGEAVDMAALRQDVSKLGEDLAAITSKAFGNGKEKIGSVANDASERLNEISTRAKDGAIASKDYLANKVRSNPLTSVAIAAGVGLAVSMLARRS